MNAPPKKDIPSQFAELAAMYEGISKEVGAGAPNPGQMVALMFIRIQMLDLKLDMLAMTLGAARDINGPRLVRP